MNNTDKIQLTVIILITLTVIVMIPAAYLIGMLVFIAFPAIFAYGIVISRKRQKEIDDDFAKITFRKF